MSVKVSTWAWEQSLPAPTKLVLLALADIADNDGKAWPSKSYLSKRTGMSRRNLVRHLNLLQKEGLLSRHTRARDNGSQTSNLYTLSLGIILIPVAGKEAKGGCQDVTPPVTSCHPPGDTGDTPPVTPMSPPIEPSLDTSLDPKHAGPLSAASLGPPGAENSACGKEQEKEKIEEMKSVGKESTTEVLKSVVSDSKEDPTETIRKTKKRGTRYTVDSLRRVWVSLHSHHGFGFSPEWTSAQRGQANMIQKKLEGIDVLQAFRLAFERWPQFTEKTEAYKPPSQPHLGFMLKYVGVLGNMALELQTVAKKKEGVGIFSATKGLTKSTEKGDNKTNDKDLLDALENDTEL